MVGQRRMGAAVCALSIALGALGCAAEGPANSNNSALGGCELGQTQMCICPGKPNQVQTCQANRTFAPCPCNAPSGGGQGGASAGASAAPGGGGAPAAGMSAQAQGGRGGSAGSMVGSNLSGRGGAGAGAGASGAGAGGATATAGSGGSAAPGTDEFAAVRQACVDEINMYRMTRGLMPLVRGTAEQETCSDMGAKQDGDSGQAHGSAGKCRGLGGQNTCPGYALSFGGGTLDGTLKFCLKQMWDEGEPAEGVQACIADTAGCFQMHGHWINMTMTSYGRVACGFYKMANGRYWMNQNFGR